VAPHFSFGPGSEDGPPASWKHDGRTTGYGRSVEYLPIGSMYGICANIGGILMVNVTIYSIDGSYGL